MFLRARITAESVPGEREREAEGGGDEKDPRGGERDKYTDRDRSDCKTQMRHRGNERCRE